MEDYIPKMPPRTQHLDFKGNLSFEEATSLNVRLLAHKIRLLAHEHNGEITLKPHRVYFSHLDSEKPLSYAEQCVEISGENVFDIRKMLKMVADSLHKPIMWAGSKFPTECIVTYKCDLCGREGFTTAQPHNCIGGNFRKRKIVWSVQVKDKK